MFSRRSLASAFRQLGLVPGDTVMLHASVKAVGLVAGGPDQIHLALLDAISPGGTVMMYAGCSDGFDDIGRGYLSQDEEEALTEMLPAFDAGVCRSARDNGILVEFLRTYPGTCATNHVARMIARGARAEWLANPAPQNYACGAGSPMDRLQQIGGKVVLLGSDHDAVTFMHFVEHVTDFPDKRIAHFRVPVEVDGKRHWLKVEEVNTSGDGAHQNWPERFFAQIVDSFISSHAVPHGLVGKADTYVLDTVALLPYAAARMQRVAAAKPTP